MFRTTRLKLENEAKEKNLHNGSEIGIESNKSTAGTN